MKCYHIITQTKSKMGIPKENHFFVSYLNNVCALYVKNNKKEKKNLVKF